MEEKKTQPFLKSNGQPASDAVFRLYAEPIRERLPSYATFWDEYVGEQTVDAKKGDLDNKRKRLLGSDGDEIEETPRNFTFLQQFSYKALWDLVAAWRAYKNADDSYTKFLDGPEAFLDFVENMESFYMRIGACEDALYKCLYCLYKLDDTIDWTKLYSTTKIRETVSTEFLKTVDAGLSSRLAEFHRKYIKSGRNLLVHYSRLPGCQKDAEFKVVPFNKYCVNKTWAKNFKANEKKLCPPLQHMNEASNDMTPLFDGTFKFMSGRLHVLIESAALRKPGFDTSARGTTQRDRLVYSPGNTAPPVEIDANFGKKGHAN